MDAESGVAFLQALHCQKIRIKDNGWIEAACPLAKWLHKHAVDNSPSFGLSISSGERSHYSCFACRHGSVEELLQTLELYTAGKSHQYDFKLCHQLLDEEQQILPLPEYGGKKSGAVEFEEWPAYWLNSFQSSSWADPAIKYLAYRNVSPTTQKVFDLRYDSKRQMIVAPYYDVFNRFAGARGRSILSEATGASKHYDYSWQGKNNYRLVWYNEPVLNLSGPIVVVEGQFDCMRVAQVFPKVVAALTAKPTFEKMKKLGDCPFIIQIPDTDETGKMSMSVYAEMCAQLGIGYKMLWLDEGVKDPDQCHPDYLKEKIEGLL